MRLVLAAWVLFAHTQNFSPIDRAMPVPSANALVAVYCFLAISGFSIHHSIDQRPDGYAARRFWRIAPIHLLSIIIALAAYALTGPTLLDGHGNPWATPPIGGWVSATLLLQAFLPIGRLQILFPSWSLSVECFYYFLAPVLRRSPKWLPYLIAGLSVAFCLYRPFVSSLYIGSDTYGVSVGALGWAWLAGWLLYRGPSLAFRLIATGGAGSLCIVFDPLLAGVFNHIAWWSTLTLCAFGRGNFLPERTMEFCNYLGELSYPLYLLHYPALFLLFNTVFVRWPDANFGIVHVVFSVLVAALAYRFVEQPLRAITAAIRSPKFVQAQD